MSNPVNYVDHSGHFAISALLVGLVFGFAGTMLTDLIDDGQVFNGSQDWKDYLGNTIAGGVGGLAGAFGLNMLGSMAFSVAGDTVGGLISGVVTLILGNLLDKLLHSQLECLFFHQVFHQLLVMRFEQVSTKQLEEFLQRILRLTIILKALRENLNELVSLL